MLGAMIVTPMFAQQKKLYPELEGPGPVVIISKDKNGKEKGNGREFEKLVRYLLYLMYGKKWRETGGSHDHNRDFWLHVSVVI